MPGRISALFQQNGDSMRKIGRFLADESGANAIEYAMIAAGIAAVLVAAIQGLGTSVDTLFVSVNTALR